MYYFDIGSSTIKLYEYKKKLSLIEEKWYSRRKYRKNDGIYKRS